MHSNYGRNGLYIIYYLKQPTWPILWFGDGCERWRSQRIEKETDPKFLEIDQDTLLQSTYLGDNKNSIKNIDS